MDEIGENLKKLIRGLTQNEVKLACEAYKLLYQTGVPAIPQIREALFKSKWTNIKYAEEIRYVTGLVGLVQDINEAEAREISNHIIESGCDTAVKRALNSICRFT